MILKYIMLENIRSYLNEKIEFPEGSVLLSGDIGSGKSTALLAVEFALFGLKRKDLEGSALLRHGKKHGSVELAFSIGKNSVIIKRNLKRGAGGVTQSSGYIIINSKKKEATAVELKSVVLDLLGYPPELLTKSKDLIYRYTVYTPQEEMKQILLEDKDARLDTLRRVFGIDKYKRIKENSVIIVKHIRENHSKYGGMVLDLEEKKIQMREREQSIKELQINLGSVLPELEHAKKEIKSKKESLKEIEKDIKKLELLNREIEIENTKLTEKVRQKQNNDAEAKRLIERAEALRKSVLKYELKKPSDQTEEEIEKEIKEKEGIINKTNAKKSLLNEKKGNNALKIKELEEEIKKKSSASKEYIVKEAKLNELLDSAKNKKEVEKKTEDFLKDLDSLNKTINELSTNKENSEELKQKIMKIGKCPTCLQDVGKEHKEHIHKTEQDKISRFDLRLKELTKEKDKAEKEVLELKKELNDISNKEKIVAGLMVEVENLKSVSEEIVEKQKLFSRLSAEMAKIKEELDEVSAINTERIEKELLADYSLLKKMREFNEKTKEREMLQRLIDENEKSIENIQKMNSEIKKEVGGINEKKMKLNEEISAFREIDGIHEKNKEELETLLEAEKSLSIKKAALEKEKESLEKQKKGLDAEVKEKMQIKEKMAYLKKLDSWLDDYFINVVGVIEKQVMLKIYYEFNDLFKDWFDMLIEDENLGVGIDEEFTPVVVQNGYEASLVNLSGGEKTSLALAYRLSLNKVINNVISTIKTKDILILDEPTDGFSSEQLDRVKDVLDEINIKQIIIVSHEPKVESFVDHVIRIRKDEHVSAVV